MPRYAYLCKPCNLEFEREQRITDATSKRCPECKRKATRLISRSTFVLKGGGWPGRELNR